MAEQVIQKQETSEVIGLDGTSQDVRTSSLAGIFDKIEAGKADGKSAQEALDTPLKIEKPEVKPDGLAAQLTDDQKAKDEAAKKAAETPVVTQPEVIPDEELKVLPTDKPKTAKRIEALLGKVKEWENVATTTKKEAEEKATKLAELEKKLSEVKTVDPKVEEETQAKLKELSMYRRRYELDKDPEVKTKFDSRVESAEQSIHESLKRRNAGEGLFTLIKEEGGWNKFAESSRLVTIPDDDGGTKQVTTAELADAILSRLPLGERKAIESAMMEQVQTKRDRERYFKEQQETASEYFKKRDEESQKGSVEQQKQIEEAKKVIENWRKGVDSSDWLKDKPVPPTATAAEKTAIEEWNKGNLEIKSHIDKAIATKDIPGMLEIFKESAQYRDERRTSTSLKAENERLKNELKAKIEEMTKFKTAGRSTQRSGSIATTASSETNGKEKPKSLEEAFDILERGGQLE